MGILGFSSHSVAIAGGLLLLAGLLLVWMAAPERGTLASVLVQRHLDALFAIVTSALIVGGMTGLAVGLAALV